MAALKLTKKIVDAAVAGGRDVFLFDSTQPGFGVKITPAGRRVCIYQYRHRGAKRRFTIGTLDAALTLDQARTRAKQLAARVQLGEDPMQSKQTDRAAGTVADLLDAYLGSDDFAAKAQTTQESDRGRVENHIKPLLGRLRVDELTAADVRRARAAIAAGKTAKVLPGDKPRGRRVVRGGEGAAGQSVTLLQAVYGWAKSEDYEGVADNPAADVKGHVSGARNIVASPLDYSRIFEALDELEADRRLSDAVAACLRLIAHTGLRRGEARDLTWSQVNLTSGCLTFAPAQHKGGKKSGVAKFVWLSTQAREVLERRAAAACDAAPTDRVFPGTSGGAVSLNRPWHLVRVAAGLPDHFVLHGLRHALASTMAANGSSAPQIAALLGHRQASTAERYVAWADSTRSGLAQRASDLIVGGAK